MKPLSGENMQQNIQPLQSFLLSLLGKAVSFLEYTGKSTQSAVKAFVFLWDRLFYSMRIKSAVKFSKRKSAFLAFFRKVWTDFSMPFRKMARVPRLTAKAFQQGGFSCVAKTLGQGIKNNRNFFATIFNYTAPALGIYLLFSTISEGLNSQYALALTANDQFVGYVSSESDFYEAKNDLISRLVNVNSSEEEGIINLSASYQVAKVEQVDITNKQDIADTLLTMSSDNVTTGYGFYVNGEFMGVLDMQAYTSVLSTMDDLLDNYRTGAEGETVEFVSDIKFNQGIYPTESLVSSHDITSLLRSNVQEQRTYTIEVGDSPIQMANKNGLTYAEFKVMNPTIEDRCIAGDEVLIATEQPYLSVKTSYETTYTENIAYETNYTYDNSKSTSYSSVTKEGKEGVMEVNAVVELVNGIESQRTILSTTVLEEPVTAEVIKGTKVSTGYTGSYYNAIKGSGQVGSMIWPVGGNGGYISQYYGNNGHRGLDIAGCGYGTDIKAAAGGTVVISGWYYSYGKCVVINHGNGVYTLYGHNSSLYVSAGDYVNQGQVIAAAGSTGNSTGVHLHFEVQVNGSTVNPLNYLG